ncbi:putative Cytosolic Protein [Bacillus velezensis YAU B9601-Y2]|uniref:Putative Cytosolic Protein n=1 Tax=Bacillus amyloliquefaciens (strain Y2) TaxID=1155777 RepID=I2C293_BACAY|nr:putative Cytosolic Protein [Bacillus velezensis YAU B9601-Y2]
MRDVFRDHDQELFYSFTLSLEKSGKLTVNFDYTDWFKTDYSFSDQLIIWKFKNLGEEPKDPSLQKLTKKYSEEYPENPI